MNLESKIPCYVLKVTKKEPHAHFNSQYDYLKNDDFGPLSFKNKVCVIYHSEIEYNSLMWKSF